MVIIITSNQYNILLKKLSHYNFINSNLNQLNLYNKTKTIKLFKKYKSNNRF